MKFEQLLTLFQETHRELQQRAARSVDIALVVRNWLFGWQEIRQALSGKSSGSLSDAVITLQALSAELASRFTLGWTHYAALLTISNPDERRFYEIEARETIGRGCRD